jgi:hypothetical protein
MKNGSMLTGTTCVGRSANMTSMYAMTVVIVSGIGFGCADSSSLVITAPVEQLFQASIQAGISGVTQVSYEIAKS